MGELKENRKEIFWKKRQVNLTGQQAVTVV
jgi:hypothetical protein